MKTDVLLLADIFENFRETCYKIYQLDPAQFYTAPGLSWSALLKFTGIELELITDVDMLTFIERGIRGGISQCSKRYAEANNKYMGDEYKPDQPKNYLMYLDGEFLHIFTLSIVVDISFYRSANNLYGHAMRQPLPTGNYQWIDENDNDNSDIEMNGQSKLFTDVESIMKLPDDGCEGYIFECDLHYPESIHDAHSDFPFCAESQKLPDEAFDIIKKREEEEINRLNIPEDENGKRKKRTNRIEKLLLTLHDREKYVLHYRMLKLALKHGLVLKKVHRILKFNQSPWMMSYIDLNTEMRTKAENDFEKAFFKLMNNAVFGND